MSDVHWPEHRAIQERFDTARLADRLEEALVTDVIDDHARTFIEARELFFLSTVDPRGRPTVSYRGGDPGFVPVIDERTIAFPNYNGNGMYVSMGNLGHNPKVVHRMEPIARSEFVPREDCVTPVPVEDGGVGWPTCRPRPIRRATRTGRSPDRCRAAGGPGRLRPQLVG